MHEQSKKFNQEISHKKKILELKDMMTDLKNSMESFNIRLGQAEKRINE